MAGGGLKIARCDPWAGYAPMPQGYGWKVTVELSSASGTLQFGQLRTYPETTSNLLALISVGGSQEKIITPTAHLSTNYDVWTAGSRSVQNGDQLSLWYDGIKGIYRNLTTGARGVKYLEGIGTMGPWGFILTGSCTITSFSLECTTEP